jgi:hypothetical protein
MNYEFSADEHVHHTTIEERLRTICEKRGLTILESKPTNVRGVRSWERKVDVPFRNTSGSLHVSVSYICEDTSPRYRLFHSSVHDLEIREGIGFWEIASMNGLDVEPILSAIGPRIDMIRSNIIAESLLPREGVWIRQPRCGVPTEFRGQVPLYQVIDEYRGDEGLNG